MLLTAADTEADRGRHKPCTHAHARHCTPTPHLHALAPRRPPGRAKVTVKAEEWRFTLDAASSRSVIWRRLVT